MRTIPLYGLKIANPEFNFGQHLLRELLTALCINSVEGDGSRGVSFLMVTMGESSQASSLGHALCTR